MAARQRGQQNAVIVGSHELDIGSLPQSSAAIEEYKDISNAGKDLDAISHFKFPTFDQLK